MTQQNWQQWWGYIHTNGSIQVKRFFSHEDIIDARSSPFVRKTYGPFASSSRDDAIQKIKELHLEKTADKSF